MNIYIIFALLTVLILLSFASNLKSIMYMFLMSTSFFSLILMFYLKNLWVSYIYFLVVVGGILILFSYSISQTMETTFEPKSYLILVVLLLFLLLADPKTMNLLSYYPVLMSFDTIFQFNSQLIFTLMFTFFLFSLIVSISVLKHHSTPLRNFSN